MENQKPLQKTKTRKRRLAASACSACGVPWTDHLGIAGTCKNLEEARGALKVIHTWATFRSGELLVPEHVWKLAWKALEASKPNDQAETPPTRDVRKSKTL